MIPLVKLREDMRFASELHEMIEVNKNATSAQFKSLQQKHLIFEDFKVKLEKCLMDFEAKGVRHLFLTGRTNLPKAVLMVTSDEGFLGGLNTNVVDAGLQAAANEDQMIVIGERGARFLRESRSGAFTALPGIGDDITYARAIAVRDLLVKRFMGKQVGSVYVVYPRFVSYTVQKVDVIRIFPCGDIFGLRKEAHRRRISALVEPHKPKVVDYMVKTWLAHKLYDIFWDSKLSECAARIVHLEESSKEIRKYSTQLRHEYFKHVHEKNDRNIREIFASRLGRQRLQEAELR